jgi:hypothetical protein
MSAGGLTGAGGGSLTGTTVLPGSVEPDASAIIKYNNAGQQRSASNAKQTGDSKKRGDDAKPAGDGDAKALGEQQSRKAQDFDAVYGRPPLGEQSGGKQQDKSNDESAFDVARRADKGAAEVVYGAAGEVVGTVNDAAGAVLHGAIGWTGVDIFKGHAERNQARGEGMWNTGKAAVEAAKSPVETVEKGIEIVKAEGAEIADEWQAGRYGDLAERSGQVAGVIAVGAFGGAATKVLRRSDGPDGVKGPDDTGSAAKGPDAPGGDKGYEHIETQVSDPRLNPSTISDGNYHVNPTGMAKHKPDTAPSGKSVFRSDIDAERATLDAARYADEHGLWDPVTNKARVPTNDIVGYHGKTGEPVSEINIYREGKKDGTYNIHGAPAGPARN